jgi:hypothetical protein
MIDPPSTTAANGDGDGDGEERGRKPNGQFGRGNRCATGNPHAKSAALLRAALFKAVTPADMEAVVAKLVEQAKAGDIASARELFQRLLGPPVDFETAERLEAVERRLADLQQQQSADTLGKD